SRGKGFAGTMKRHGFGGLGASHGTQGKHRSPGAIGACATPSRVFKGTRMAGQMGNERVTVLNLEVVHADPERNLLLLKGAVTGRARHGSNRSPIWTGGGVAHGPKPRDHSMRVNKKMKRNALRGALTDTLGSGKLALVEDLGLEEPRTKDAQALLGALGLQGKVLLVLPAPGDQVVELSFRNLPYVKVSYARSLSVY